MTTTVSESGTGDFTAPLGRLIAPSLVELAARLGEVAGLAATERDAVHAAAVAAVVDSVHRKVSRVLLLELNAARVTGRLAATTSEGRWAEFAALASTPAYWEGLAGPYPTLLTRLRTVVAHRCAAALLLAHRFAADRAALGALVDPVDPVELGDLVEVTFGAGDSHRGGHTVAVLRAETGTIVYKPRSVAVDAALAGLLTDLLPDEPPATRIRVPAVLARDGYGWAAHVTHRYCGDEAELRAFYRGIGHWLAVMRLLGGTDLHAENVLACGPVPVVVDCETLFSPLPAGRPSGLGLAADRAGHLVENTVLRIGLLPGRGVGLGWRGVDLSAVGSLPGQQPLGEQPVIVDGGTDRARIGTAPHEVPVAANHPSPQPALARHWGHVLAGFDQLTTRMVDLDRAGHLAPLLARFADCPVRVVPRGTEVYAEVARMLWHPVSLHDEPAAVARAADLLTTMAATTPGAPDDPAVVAAEIDALLVGDIPFFSTTPADLIAGAVGRWRAADLPLERTVIRSALVSAYLNDGWMPETEPMRVAVPRLDDRDRRRRAQAAALMRRLAAAAIRAEDGTATWIAPVLNPTGWAVQPLSPDVYGGAPGVAVLLAAYLHETAAGRADPVPGLADLLAGTLSTVRRYEDRLDADRRAGTRLRPPSPGGYIGLGAQIRAWLLLDRLGAAGDALDRAGALAAQVPAAVRADAVHDLLIGTAGAIVPLLTLARRTGEQRWVDVAAHAGDRLVAAATHRAGTAYWPTATWPSGLGGFAHGSTGIGWALHRLARVTGDAKVMATAGAAFAFDDRLYDPAAGGWRDLRRPETTDGAGRPAMAAAWCHGAVGIGLAAADLFGCGAVDVLGRAAAATWAYGMGWSHTLCHGDLGSWELLDAAIAAGAGPAGLDRPALDAHVLGSMEEHRPVSGLARDAFVPGLLPGLGGVAYQLLRMHPGGDLPSLLVPGGEAA